MEKRIKSLTFLLHRMTHQNSPLSLLGCILIPRFVEPGPGSLTVPPHGEDPGFSVGISRTAVSFLVTC